MEIGKSIKYETRKCIDGGIWKGVYNLVMITPIDMFVRDIISTPVNQSTIIRLWN